MTLAEWESMQPVTVGHHGRHGTRFVPDVAALVDRSAAWRLTDYAVSSVTAGTIWLVRRGSSHSMIEAGETI